MIGSEWDFCPKFMVPRTKAPSTDVKGMSFNGWNFSSRPRVPFQRTFVVRLQGMYWYLKNSGVFDESTDPRYNARRLELFYERHGLWKDFAFPHPHLGTVQCRFKEPVEIPEAMVSSGGLIEAFEVQLVEHNPGYREW